MHRVSSNSSVFSIVLIKAILWIAFFTGNATGTDYYVDSQSGSDSNEGTSESQAWQSLVNVNYPELADIPTTFQEEDRILFKRGCSWTGGLLIKYSGIPGYPITYSAYGTGAMPVLKNPGTNYQRSIDVLDGVGYIVIENLMLQDAHEAGVFVRTLAHDVAVRDCEATRVGVGVYLVGYNNLVEHCYFHNLTMVLDTPTPTNDDYGAVGVNIHNSNNEVRYCTFVDCNAHSYDYVTDGGAVEIYASARDISNVYFHHSYALRTNGFMEIGGGRAVQNVKIYQNVFEDTAYDLSMCIHDGRKVSIKNIQLNNNTIVQHVTGDGRPVIWGLIGFTSGTADPQFFMQNNIIYSEYIQSIVRNGSRITSHNNLIKSTYAGSILGFTPDPNSDIVGFDPLFVSKGEWQSPGDFHLQAGSLAIDSGVTNLGYTVDLDGTDIPQGTAPDRGAYEFISETPPDEDPPVITRVGPPSELPAGTTYTDLHVTTNEAADCELYPSYDESGNPIWAPFTTTGGTDHTTKVTGLSDGNTYSYSVRATDGVGNTSSDFVITFTIRIDDIPPVITLVGPPPLLPAGTAEVDLHVTTDEAADCELYPSYDESGNPIWAPFTTTGGTDHTTRVTGLSDGNTYTYLVRATDGVGNTSSDFAISITIDATPPVITLVGPPSEMPAGTAEVDLHVTTDEAADCSYLVGTVWAPFTTTGGTDHTTRVTGLSDGNTYTYLVRATDGVGNTSSDFAITFTILQDSISPVITIIRPAANQIFTAGTTVVTLQVTTDETATCQYSLYPLTEFGSAQFFDTVGGIEHNASVNVIDGAYYTYYIRGRDEAGNVNPDDSVIQFSVAEPANIVAHYNLNTDFNDLTVNGNHGTPQNGAALADDGVGVNSMALSLDGSDDFVQIPDSNSLDLTSAITLEAWVNTADSEGDLINKSNSYSLSIANGKPQFSLFIASAWRTITSNTTLVPDEKGTWYHIVATYSSAASARTMRIYVNGALASSQTKLKGPSYTITPNSSPVNLGTGLSGLMDEVRIFNRDLTVTEIQARYNALKP